MKEMALKRTLICKLFWAKPPRGSFLSWYMYISAPSELKSVSLFSCKGSWNVWAIPFIHYTYKIFIDWVSVKHYEMLMLASQFTFYSHWRSSCSNCCQSIFNLDKLSWGTRDYWGQNKLVQIIRTHKTLPLTMMVTMKIMATFKSSWQWWGGGKQRKGRKDVIIEKTAMVKKKNKDKIFSLKGIYMNSPVSEIWWRI